jgi:NAD(P)-dependent dehydrogenase (short-subunit alcohol dehydrogenase family)
MRSSVDLFRLDGKIALVSGGTGVVGGPISEALSEAGATVIVASRNAKRCRDFAEILSGRGLKAEGEMLDLSSETRSRSFAIEFWTDMGVSTSCLITLSRERVAISVT